MASSPSLPQLYRSILRQLTLNSIHPRAAQRSPSISLHLRRLFESYRAASPKSAALIQRDVDNMVTYLKAHRLHKELVDRYNSSDGLTQEERATKSAQMVGLDMPQAFEEGRAPTMEFGRVQAEARRIAEAEKKAAEEEAEQSSSGGSLRKMFAPES